MNTKSFLEANEERLELLRCCVILAREDDSTVVAIVITEVHKVTIAESILRHFETLEIQVDDAVDAIDG